MDMSRFCTNNFVSHRKTRLCLSTGTDSFAQVVLNAVSYEQDLLFYYIQCTNTNSNYIFDDKILLLRLPHNLFCVVVECKTMVN